jgi:SAM-dependent methyltransferase
MTASAPYASSPAFTGERMVLGDAADTDVADHLARYRFAGGVAARCRVLDIACGTGYGAPMLLDGGASSVVGVDVDAPAVAHAAAAYGGPRAQFEVGDVTTYGESRSFDLITCFETIEHVPDARAALVNLERLLAPGGRLLVSSPNRILTSPFVRSLSGKPRNQFHVREFVPGELRDLMESVGLEMTPTLYGQRVQPHLPWWAAPLYTKLTRSYELLDPTVRAITRGDPRLFVLEAVSPPESQVRADAATRRDP